MQLLFSFDQEMRVKKTLIQTLAGQLSSTLMQLLFSFDQDMRVEKTLIQTLACQLSSILMQLLFSFDQDMRVEKTLIQTLACQLSSTPILNSSLFKFQDYHPQLRDFLGNTDTTPYSETYLGYDGRNSRYLYFPVFDATDIRIYKQAELPALNEWYRKWSSNVSTVKFLLFLLPILIC